MPEPRERALAPPQIPSRASPTSPRRTWSALRMTRGNAVSDALVGKRLSAEEAALESFWGSSGGVAGAT